MQYLIQNIGGPQNFEHCIDERQDHIEIFWGDLRDAQAVRRAVVNAARTADFDQIDVDVAAFGEAMPMACDDSAWGRQVNRRVEVWIR